MTDQGERQREHDALSKRYVRDDDGGLRFVPTGAEDPGRRVADVVIIRADGSEPVLLTLCSMLLDIALHLAIGGAVGVGLAAGAGLGAAAAGCAGVLAWIAASFTHRTLIQWRWGTTLGKAPFGLALRAADHSALSFGRLVRHWFVGAFHALAWILLP
ncbi:RDD family protein [Nocardia thailandica]|uniref:RDD family protein n=1 Tax=Nocardia thailandica TaxID=257275 RepID=UPI0005B89B71|nr:RDD family protein [Nocardia thailandica]